MCILVKLKQHLKCWELIGWDMSSRHESMSIISLNREEGHANRKLMSIFLEKTRKGHCQSDQHYWCYCLLLHHLHHHLSLTHRGLLRCQTWLHNQFPSFFSVLHCPLGLGKLQACPFPDFVCPPLFCCCLPCLLPPFNVPCKTVLARPDERETCPYHCSLHLFTISAVFFHWCKATLGELMGDGVECSGETYGRWGRMQWGNLWEMG